MRAGQLYELRRGGRVAMVTEQGATLYRVNWEGQEVLARASEDGYATAGCFGQLLVPWPGRVRHGTYIFKGERHDLAISDPAHDAAIHGLVRWLPWQLRESGPDFVTLAVRLLASPGYPWPLELEQSYRWLDSELEVVTEARNIGAHAAPFGYGMHPYFAVGTDYVDTAEVHLPAREYLKTLDDLSPVLPPVPVDGTVYDFTKPRPVGPTELDVTYAGLQRDPDGLFRVSIRHPGGGTKVTCTYDRGIDYVQLYSGDTLSSGRRRALAIEPYTCVPDTFNNGLGLIELAPGTSVTVRWTLAVS